jgi:hypothetical protein
MGIHYISNNGHDENGGSSGGVAGDQTGTEWELTAWYARPWDLVLRYPVTDVQLKIADLAEKAAKNDMIGYDQGERTTFWQQLAANEYDPSKIKVPCESDCSSGVAAIVKATGYLLGIRALQEVSQELWTGIMRQSLVAAGFEALTDTKYTSSPDYLLPGDILLNEAHHTAINISRGTKAGGTDLDLVVTPGTAADTGAGIGTCTVSLHTFLVGAQNDQVRAIQRLLNAIGYKGKNGAVLSVDGILGTNTSYAIETLQRDSGMTNINFGTVAARTWELLLNAK